ncbi:MAG: hypothetical protein MUO72_01680 [Bacteroidales bacterium]|nr:hypothetical protein [Bacteroidales bacterium]
MINDLLIIFFLIGSCFIVGIIGNKRTIGFGKAFFFSLFFSPIVGLIITLLHKKEGQDIESDQKPV